MEKLGRPPLAPTMNYLKLVDQIFIELIETLKNVKTHIMGISRPFEPWHDHLLSIAAQQYINRTPFPLISR
jgi:hypothetical protein